MVVYRIDVLHELSPRAGITEEGAAEAGDREGKGVRPLEGLRKDWIGRAEQTKEPEQVKRQWAPWALLELGADMMKMVSPSVAGLEWVQTNGRDLRGPLQ